MRVNRHQHKHGRAATPLKDDGVRDVDTKSETGQKMCSVASTQPSGSGRHEERQFNSLPPGDTEMHEQKFFPISKMVGGHDTACDFG